MGHRWKGRTDIKAFQTILPIFNNGAGERETQRQKIKAAVVVAQLAERSLLTPEIRDLNPDIGNKIFQMYICQLLFRKDKNKEK